MPTSSSSTRTANPPRQSATSKRKERKWYKNLAVVFANIIPKVLLNETKVLRRLLAQAKKYSYNECQWGGNLFGAWGFKEIMPKEIMGEPTLYSFESIQVYGAEKFDEYLTHLYGDWRKLPPPEKRVTHHDYILCDLEKSYMEREY